LVGYNSSGCTVEDWVLKHAILKALLALGELVRWMIFEMAGQGSKLLSISKRQSTC